MKIRYLLLSLCLIAAGSPEGSPKDAFFLRRITEFWKDKDYALVKKQILEFLSANPNTSVSDNLYAILGDLYFQEENNEEALAAYQKIAGKEFRLKTSARHLFCLHQKEDWAAIASFAYPLYQEAGEDVRYLLSEALYRQISSCEDGAQKIALAEQAKPVVLSLSSDKYKERTLFPLAEVHRLLKEYPQAASLYMILAEKEPDQAHDLMFQAATLQLEFDKNEALKTYGLIMQKGGNKAEESAFNTLVLLYQDEQYAALAAKEELLSKNISEDKIPLFHYCMGRSHFNLEEWNKTALHLEQPVPAEYQKNSIITLLVCAQKSADMALFDRTLEKLTAAFPNDSETAKALLLHAQFSLQKENLTQANTDLEKVLLQFPEYGDKENLVYDHALILSQSKNWRESRKTFLSYLDQFPQTLHGDTIWSYILNCSIQELKEASPESLQAKKEQFASDLQICLKRDSVFTSDERVDYHFLLGKTFFELGETDKVIETLQAHVASFPSHPTAAEAHLLMALSFQDSNPKAFAEHAEAALSLNPDVADRGILHLQLFNAYLSLHEQAQAADHLYSSYIDERRPIQRENELWLANYYYGSAKERHDSLSQARAIILFQSLLGIKDDQMVFDISASEPFLEVEALKLADLLDGQKKVTLLSALVNVQDQHPDFSWKFQRQTAFELGKAYENIGEIDKAVAVFDRLVQTSTYAPSYFSSAAQLQQARLLYSRCEECDRNESSEKMGQILSNLKDLQIQKKLLSEPTHLEAALEYADIRASFAAPESRIESILFYLNRIKEDFSSQDDLISKEYHESRSRLPEKDLLFQNYMKCIEAEMLRLEAITLKKASDFTKAKQNEEVALVLLEELRGDKHLTPYLKNRVENNLKALGK